MMRLSVLLLIVVATAGIALGPAPGVLACTAPASGFASGGGEAAPEENLPVLQPGEEARIIVRQPASSTDSEFGPVGEGEAVNLAFAAAALAAPAFAAVSLALARGRAR